jgi:Zn-dependent metalloprotease
VGATPRSTDDGDAENTAAPAGETHANASVHESAAQLMAIQVARDRRAELMYVDDTVTPIDD